MRTRITEMFNIDVPVFAFSHCRDVVVEATKAGAFGVLGAAAFGPEQLDMELKWIDEHVGGRPYGVDVLMPAKLEKVPTREGSNDLDLERAIPKGHRDWVEALLKRHNVPPLPEGENLAMARGRGAGNDAMSLAHAEKLLHVAFDHNVKLMASGLGVPPKEVVDEAHKRGIRVAGLLGKVEQSYRHRDAGVDFVIAAGTEAGGHTGDISTLVLVPQVVDAMAPLPVVAAGGIGSGRQVAAALMLGAEAVWCGSLWLTTRESDMMPELKQKLLGAKSTDVVRGKWMSGKPQRHLRSGWSAAWEAPDAPKPLLAPLQGMLIADAQARIARYKAMDLMTSPLGQVVGLMNEERSVRQVIQEIMNELADSAERFDHAIADAGAAEASAPAGK